MENKVFLKPSLQLFVFAIVSCFVFNSCLICDTKAGQAMAATNLINGGSFEGDMTDDWQLWQTSTTSNSYELYRSYDTPFGLGSFSAAIEGQGSQDDMTIGGLVTRESSNTFNLEAGKAYYLILHTKSDQDMSFFATISRLDNYENLYINEITPTRNWYKHMLTFTSDYTGACNINFFFNSIPTDSSLFLDGVQLFASDANITTKTVSGYIGDRQKKIAISGVGNFSQEDIEVELPFYDENTLTYSTRRYQATKVDAKYAYIDMPEQTFSGIGRAYISGQLVGSFNYEVKTRIKQVFPSHLRVDEDFTLTGDGFSPVDTNTWLVMKAKNANDSTYEKWIQFDRIDSKLSQLSSLVPFGTVSGTMFVQTHYVDMDGEVIMKRSNTLKYHVKPSVHSSRWSVRGYEQVGDKLTIVGKGISNRPYVNFYNENNEKIDRKKAKVIEITENEEVIEVESTSKQNEFKITVEVNGIESDLQEALNGVAKPVISEIKSSANRAVSYSSERIQAAKVDEEITIEGSALKLVDNDTVVRFSGIDGDIEVIVSEENIETEGRKLKVNVPRGAQSGQVVVRINDVVSNRLTLEIIPDIIDIYPVAIVPGGTMQITASGIGAREDLLEIVFKFDRSTEITVAPSSVVHSENIAVITLIAPRSISNDSTTVGLKYGNWSDDSQPYLSASPQVMRASIDMDTKILSIKGSGFSVNPRENIITYKYADENQTVINPKVKMLGVYNTEEGQEIRIQLQDDYHYGYVTVTVDGQASNEVQFGPVKIHRTARRIEFVRSLNEVKGVLYISGHNFGTEGGVLLSQGENQVWAEVHYRTNFFIIAVVDQEYVNYESVVIARQ